MNKTIGIILGFLILAIVVLASIGVFKSEKRVVIEGELVAFAQCLEEKGATFYGAFWCPHCQAQHRTFGKKGSDALPYTECSTPDGQGQTDVCKEAGIESYPTWEFADGARVTGEQSIETLAEKTGCPITSNLLQESEAEINTETPVNMEVTQ